MKYLMLHNHSLSAKVDFTIVRGSLMALDDVFADPRLEHFCFKEHLKMTIVLNLFKSSHNFQ